MEKLFEGTLLSLYGKNNLDQQKKRYQRALDEFCKEFGTDGLEHYQLFSAPGRTEIGGNHTDHNCGKVLAASVGLDVIAVVVPTADSCISIKSEGFDRDDVNLSGLEPVPAERGSSAALIRGVAAGFAKEGFKLGGFRAYTISNVLKGSGLASSAAFEVLLGTILNHLYNDGRVPEVKIAQIGQFAENEYFGKPSGLMDQMSSAVGGFVALDFKHPERPLIERIDFDLAASGYTLCIVNTKADHANLMEEYASIPAEMSAIAGFFSCSVLRQITKEDIILNIKILREQYGDRAVLRAMHYFDENKRVERLSYALKVKDFPSFLHNIALSGNSSYKYLQNIYSVHDTAHQALAIGLYTAEKVLNGRGCCRVHGGGFAGTIQAFVQNEALPIFQVNMENIFGTDCCHMVSVRPVGGVKIDRE